MAEVPLENFATVAPDDRMPDDYQRVSTNPDMFGGAIAKGIQELGQGALTASKFYGQAAADQGFNGTQDEGNKVLHGDPNVIGPDGKPDTGYFGLEGQAAMDARAGVIQKLNDIVQRHRQTLSTPESQLEYDNYARRWLTGVNAQIGTYADGQSKTWAQSVNTDTAALAANGIAQDIDDPEKVQHHITDMVAASGRNAELHGAKPGDPVWTAAVTDARQKALAVQVQTIGVKDPAAAQALLESKKDIAGDTYDDLSRGLKERADAQAGIAAGSAALGGAQIKADPTKAIPPTQGDPYALVPKKGAKGEDQASMFHMWNPDPVGNNAQNLKSVNPALQAVYARALHDNPSLKFVVGSGERTQAQQAQAVQWGWSNTNDSEHLTGNAYDLWPVNGKGQVYFDPKAQGAIGQAMKKAAGELGIQGFQWGGDFRHPDLTHFQVPDGTTYTTAAPGTAKGPDVQAAPGGQTASAAPAVTEKPDFAAGPKAPILGGAAPSWATAGMAGAGPAPIIPPAVKGAPPSTQSLVDHIDGFLKMPGWTNRLVEIESAGNPNAYNKGSGATGLAQFIPSTWSKFGHGDPRNPADNLAALARLTQANYQSLRLGLGREPTGGELYLAHQQGAGGAVRLLANPDAPAASIVGLKAVLANGGTQDMTAGQFAAKWINTFNKTPGKPLPAYAQAAQNDATGGVPPIVLPDFTPPPPAAAAPAPSTPASAAAPPPPPAPASASESGQTTTDQKYQTMKSDAYATILGQEQRGEISPEAASHAFQLINQAAQVQQLQEQEQEKQKKQDNDDAANGYTTEIFSGKATPDIVTRIASDPKLSWETKHTLASIAEQQGGNDTKAALGAFGPSFYDTYKRVISQPGTPGHIGDKADLLAMALPGPDGKPPLTLAGVAKLQEAMGQMTKSVDDQAVHTVQGDLLTYAKQFLSFNQDQPPLPGMPAVKDPVGEAQFNSVFVPKFMASYDSWVKAGKNPWDFLTKENVDKMIQNTPGIRSKAQRDADLVAATKAAQPPGSPQPPVKVPDKPYDGPILPPPAPGIDSAKWQVAASHPPILPDGTYMPQATWGKALLTLLSNPTDRVKQQFAETFGAQGYDPEHTLKLLMTNYDPKARAPSEEVGDHHQAVKPSYAPGRTPTAAQSGLEALPSTTVPNPTLIIPSHAAAPAAASAPTLGEIAGKYPAPPQMRQDPNMGAGWSPPVTGGKK